MFSTVVVIVLSSLSWLGGLSSLLMTQSCFLACHGSTHMDGALSHKTNVVLGIDRHWTHVVYARAHTYMH
nr:MAG TPA: hypothetical protein [Caudoviricetes sp.]